MGTNREEKWESFERKNGNQLKAKEFILDLCKNYLKYKNDKMKNKKRKKKRKAQQVHYKIHQVQSLSFLKFHCFL